MSSYNIIVIHICCAGFKIFDEQKDAAKAAKKPNSRKRKETESSDEDFCDEREGNGSEDDTELAAEIAAQEKRLALTKEALMSRKNVVQAPTAVSRAIRPNGKGKGAAKLVPTVRAAVGKNSCSSQGANVPAAAGSGRARGTRGEDVPAAAGRGRYATMPDLVDDEDSGSDDGDKEEDDQRPAPKPQRTGPAVESDEPAQPYMTYMLNPRAQSVHVRADYVLPCEVGSNLNQRVLDVEFVEVLARKFIEEGRSVFTTPVALLIAEETVPKCI